MTEASILQLLGIIYLTIGIGLVINPKFYKKTMNEIIQSKPILYLSSILGLILWFLLINYKWSSEWNIILILNFIWWIAIIKSISIIIFPQYFIKFVNSFLKNFKTLQLMWSLIILLGLAFLYLGCF